MLTGVVNKMSLPILIRSTTSIASGGQLPRFLSQFIRRGPSPQVRATLKKYGNVKISSARVCRRPLATALQWVANKLNPAIRKSITAQGFDQLFHLFTLLKLENGVTLLCDKVEVVRLEEVPADYLESGQECITIDLGHQDFGTPASLIDGAVSKLGPTEAFLYDLRDNNCQVWTVALLNRYLTDKDKKFIMQDVTKAIASDSILRKLGRALTDTGALFHRIWYGRGQVDLPRSSKRQRVSAH